MTLAELLPSLRGSLPRRLAPGAWPGSARHLPAGDLAIGGVGLRAVARRVGAPVAVVDLAAYEADVLGVGRFVQATAAAELATAIAVSMCGQRVVRASGLPGPEHGTILVADAAELRRVERRSSVTSPASVVLVIAPRGRRRAPGHDDGTEAFDPYGSSFAEALRTVHASPRLEFAGLYCRATGGEDAVLRTVRFGIEVVAALHDSRGAQVERLFVRLEPADRRPVVGPSVACGEAIGSQARRAVRLQTAALGIPAPQLLLDPGPALAAPCEVVVHRVGEVVASSGHVEVRLDATIDDLAADDLGPDDGTGAPGAAHLLSRLSCASDAVVRLTARRDRSLGREVLLPLDVQPGDLIALPALGRTGLCVSRRSPLVGVRDGEIVPLLAGICGSAAAVPSIGRSVTA